MEQRHKSQRRKLRKKQFLVDPARVELDEYMLTQIHKNKRKVKSLRKEVSSLRREVTRLQQQHDDYLLLEKTRTPDYSHSHQTAPKPLNHARVALAEPGKKCKYRPKGQSLRRESSLLSVSSSTSSATSFRNNQKTLTSSRNLPSSSAKSRLSRKIDELKSKALLEEKEREKIRNEVKEKIQTEFRSKINKDIVQDSAQVTPPVSQPHQEVLSEDYHKLLELLRTSRSQRSHQHIAIQEPTLKPFLSQTPLVQAETPKIRQGGGKPCYQQKQVEIVHSPITNPFNSSIFHQKQELIFSLKEAEENNYRSETNLLESSSYRTPEVASPVRSGKKLQLTKALELCIAAQQSSEESGNFEGLLGCPGKEVRGGVEMSFEGGDSSKRRLRQLQFQFDQLVRQQLMVSDAREKEMLSQTIRSVLWSINELKAQMSGRASKDSG